MVLVAISYGFFSVSFDAKSSFGDSPQNLLGKRQGIERSTVVDGNLCHP